MNTHPDFEELLRLLEEHRVDYMIVGGYAVAYHGYPRFTNDIDLFFNSANENATRLRDALIAFGFHEKDLPPEAFSSSGAGGHYFTVFAGAELVVVQNPGRQHRSDRGDMANPELLRILLDACG